MKHVLVVSLLILSTTIIAFGQCNDVDKKKLEAFDRAWGEAGQRGDRAFLQNVFADNYVGLSPAGMLTKAQAIDAAVKQADRDRANPQDAAKVGHDYYMISCTPVSATITHRNVIAGKTEGKEWTNYTRSVHFLERSGDHWVVVSNAGQPLNDEGALLYLEQEWNDASKKGDVTWFERNYAGDATDISSRTGLVHTKVEEIASMKSDKQVLDSLELSDLNVRVEGNAAIVTGINSVKGHDAKGQAFDRKTRNGGLKLPGEPGRSFKVINLYINERRVGKVTVLDLKGRVRVGGGTVALHRSIRTLVEEGKTQILLNLSGVTHIDSSGLGELISSHITVQNKGGEIKLAHLTERLRDLMTITKLLTVFDVYDDEPQALATFTGELMRIVEPQPLLI